MRITSLRNTIFTGRWCKIAQETALTKKKKARQVRPTHKFKMKGKVKNKLENLCFAQRNHFGGMWGLGNFLFRLRVIRSTCTRTHTQRKLLFLDLSCVLCWICCLGFPEFIHLQPLKCPISTIFSKIENTTQGFMIISNYLHFWVLISLISLL